MKKDFSQPFEVSDLIHVSLFVEVNDKSDSRFILIKSDDKLPVTEFLPLTTTIKINEEPVMQITRFLYENGLLLNNLRELVKDTSVEFTFVDDTPGRAETMVCYHARVEIAEKNDNLAYVSAAEFNKSIRESSFIDKAELAAANMLING